jgi:hypothetical protein
VSLHTLENAGKALAHGCLHQIKQSCIARQGRTAEDHRPATLEAVEFAPELHKAVVTLEQPQRRGNVLEGWQVHGLVRLSRFRLLK